MAGALRCAQCSTDELSCLLFRSYSSLPGRCQRIIVHVPAAVLRSSEVVAAPLVLGRLEPQRVACECACAALRSGAASPSSQVLAMLSLVFVLTAILSSAFLSLTVAFACYASIPSRTMAFTLLAVGAEAPDCIVNFMASRCFSTA
jgi:hypothetical protein